MCCDAIHPSRPASDNTVDVAEIVYGTDIPTEAELRLCGDLGEHRRAVELGISPWRNALQFAERGAKAIAVDPNPATIADLRERAMAAEVTVQCLEAELADLGDITSASCDVVLAAQSLHDIDDLGRVLRQVHRILKPGARLVISVPHPVADVTAGHPYGSSTRTVGDWFTALERTNFSVGQLRELGVGPASPAPTTLVLRAAKQGL